MLKFIHTSDWQIGKAFAGFPEDARGALREARTETIRSIGQVAMARGISYVLVAGDVYDIEEPSDLTLARPIEIMRGFGRVAFHLIPGNHDSARSEGIWARLLARGLPENVQVHLTPVPTEFAPGAWLLPSPLPRRRSIGDLTAWTETAATPAGALRIGMAHGAVVGFRGDGEMEGNLVPPTRPEQSGLAYLALGDWHGMKRIGPRLWYSGTHEPDRFKPVDGGTASGGGSVLEVSIAGVDALPEVNPIAVGKYAWHALSPRLMMPEDLGVLVSSIEALGEVSRLLVKLTVEGALSLAEMAAFDDRIGTRLAASLMHLDLDAGGLLPQPTLEDLEAIDKGGFVRAAAEQLKAIAEGPDVAQARIARLALTRLYVEVQGGRNGARGNPESMA